MTPEEYATLVAAISAAVARYVLQLGKLFRPQPLSHVEWLTFLGLLYPEVKSQRTATAELGRQLYDAQREEHLPQLPRNDHYLVEYDFEDFVADMAPTRSRMSLEDAPESAVGEVALRAVRNVENGGRQQIIRAVRDDDQLAEIIEAQETYEEYREEISNVLEPQFPRSRVVRGWARVATGRETCAWCLMLISRGPTYLGGDLAGLDIDDSDAMELYESASDMETYFESIGEHMAEWHDGCDCKVIPVFKQEDWFGRKEADRALELWNDATKEAIKLIDSGEARSDNRNREVLNALRRRFDRGEINPTEFAAIAA